MPERNDGIFKAAVVVIVASTIGVLGFLGLIAWAVIELVQGVVAK